MGLLLICPHCHIKLPLACRTCHGCGADLRHLPAEDRHYFIGEPGVPEIPAPAPEIIPEPSPETIEVEVLETFSETDEVEVLETFSETKGGECWSPNPLATLPEAPLLDNKDVSLCEALDRILNKGAVLFGEVMISVADIDLVYLGLQVILASMETARGLKPAFGEAQVGPNIFAKGVY